MSARKPSMLQYSNKNTQGQIDQSLEHGVIHIGAYVSAYGSQGRGSNMKNVRNGENKLLNVV